MHSMEKDAGSASWEMLADKNESNPGELAEHSVAQRIESKPVFACSVDFALKKRDQIISAVKRGVIKKTHKFGTMHFPNNVDEAHLPSPTKQAATPFGLMLQPRR